MAEIPKDLKFMLFGRGPMWHARVAFALDILGMVCLIVGIIAGVAGSALGLGATDWILLAIALWVWGIWAWLAAYLGAREG